MGKYHIDPHKVALGKGRAKTNAYLNKNNKMHTNLKTVGSIIILSSLFGFMISVLICSIL